MVFSMLAGLIGDLVLLPAMLRQWPSLLNPAPSVKDRANRTLTTQLSRAAGIGLLVLLPAKAFPLTNTELKSFDLKEFAKKSSSQLFARDERVTLQMVNVEADGEKQTREIELLRMTSGGSAGSKSQKMVARISSPKTLKGTSVLAVTDGETQTRWIYLPSSKQVRRVVGGDETSAPILGSEVTTEDLNLDQIDGARAKAIDRSGGKVRVETTLPSKETSYSKCVATFDEATALLESAICDDKSGRPVKRIHVKSYRKIKGSIVRPTEMEIENLQTKRKTILSFTDHKVNLGLGAREFSPDALKSIR